VPPPVPTTNQKWGGHVPLCAPCVGAYGSAYSFTKLWNGCWMPRASIKSLPFDNSYLWRPSIGLAASDVIAWFWARATWAALCTAGCASQRCWIDGNTAATVYCGAAPLLIGARSCYVETVDADQKRKQQLYGLPYVRGHSACVLRSNAEQKFSSVDFQSPRWLSFRYYMYRVGQKSKPLLHYQQIVLKPANEASLLLNLKPNNLKQAL